MKHKIQALEKKVLRRKLTLVSYCLWVSQLQGVLGSQKQVAKAHLKHKQSLRKELKEWKHSYESVQAELLELKSESLQTRKDGRGRPFLDSIEKCLMNLIGECDVPSTKTHFFSIFV